MPLDNLPDPPGPPEAPRRVRLYRYQWVGLGLIALLPILALAGAFGETWSTATGRSAALEVEVRYPTAYRYKQLNSLELRIRNTSAATLDTVTVSLDASLATAFSTVRATPAFVRAYETDLIDLRPDEVRLVVIELQAERYGRHEGVLRAAGPDTVRIPLSITIFP